MADVTLNALIRTNADIVAWLDSRSKWPMDRADVSFWLSVTGFATSTVLAIIKGVEFYAARRIVFTADTRLTNNREIGNTIVLLNKSNIPTTISNFQLVWIGRRSFFGWRLPFTRKYRITGDLPPEGYDVTIAPHATHSIKFSGEHHFKWGFDLDDDIYLKLWLVGRNSPIWLWIASPY